MEILTAAIAVVLFAQFICRKPQVREDKKALPKPIAELEKIGKILKNIEAYDGTARGQKRIGGEGR